MADWGVLHRVLRGASMVPYREWMLVDGNRWEAMASGSAMDSGEAGCRMGSWVVGCVFNNIKGNNT